MLEPKMLEILNKIRDRYNELNELSTNQQVLENIKEYTKIMRELNNIKEVVETFNKYLEIENNYNGAKLLLSEKDDDIVNLAKLEIANADQEMEKLEKELSILLLPKDENDDFDVIMEIRGAAGGDEANIFAGDLFKMYSRWADANNIKIKVLDASAANAGGFTQIIFSASGDKVYSKLKFESGVHRVQRVPDTETQGRIHTSTSTVVVMPEISNEIEIEINPSDLKIDTFRSSGAGGQSVNTTDSAVRITHLPTKIVVTCQEGRSQIENKDFAMKILKSRLYDLEIQKREEQSSSFRKLGGSGARSEKIRTYNYPQDRVTDHRIGYSTSLKPFVAGSIDNIIELLTAAYQADLIKNEENK